jgi:hypothetical protein
MWTLIIILLLFITGCVLSFVDEYGNRISLGFGLLCIFISLGVFIFSVVTAFNIPVDSKVKEVKTDIVALSNGTQSQGSMTGAIFIVSGSINQKPVYYYFEQTSDKGYKQSNISSDNVIIYQDTVDTGYIKQITYYNVTKPDYAKRWKGWAWYYSEYLPYKVTTEIHVPPNTINQQFNLDLARN